MTINSENVYTWVYRLFLGIQFPFMVSCWGSWNIVNTQIVVQHEPMEPDWCTEMLTIKHVLHRGWLAQGDVVCWLFTYKFSRSYRPNPPFNSHRIFIHGIKFKLSSDKKKVTQRCTIHSDLKHIIHERINIHLAGWQISWWWAPKLNPERIHCYCTVIVHVPNT